MSPCTHKRRRHPSGRGAQASQHGFTMLEVLISLLLVSVALLGQASMLTTAYVVPTASATVSTAAKNCATSACSNDELASFDLSVWEAAVISNLPGATWQVTRAGSPVTYTIVLTWQERRDNARRVIYETVGAQETASLTATKVIAP